MAIYVLDQHTAELIAAGEVVERPASVVKELTENAIDAGAASIVVDIERGGIDLIRVQDNGSGIDVEDIAVAFLRHATSKVRTKEDLDSIVTLGFRGEALASIASVSQIQLLTKTPADEFASEYTIHGGQEQGLAPSARPVGTTITVQNLFYNTPARMKFLKKDVSEGTFVTETVTRLALSHPEVAFCYTRDGKQVFATPGDGRLESAAYAVLGANFARELLVVKGEEQRYSVTGLITPPRGGRASRSMQFFFINGRFVKNRTMMAALEQAYRGTMMHGKFPGCVLFMQMPPDLVDVNVHPAKTEVRFAREGDVFDAVYKACKTALLGDFSHHSSFSMPKTKAEEKVLRQAIEGGGVQPIVPQQAGTMPAGGPSPLAAASPFAAANPSVSQPLAAGIAGGIGGKGSSDGTSSTGTSGQNPQNPARVRAYNEMVDALASESSMVPYETKSNTAPLGEWGLNIENDTPEASSSEPGSSWGESGSSTVDIAASLAAAAPALGQVEQTSLTLPEIVQAGALRLVGEIFKTYIIAEMGEAICLIDKHAAHERMLYEQLVAARGNPPAQQLLVPATAVLSAAEKTALLQNQSVLAEAGIELDDFGGNEVLVRAVPADVEPNSIEDLVIEVAQRMVLNSRDTLSEKTEWVLHSMACRAAVKAGDKTTSQELLKLAADILEGSIPPFCPHGRPVVLEITRKELEKQFGRLG